MPSPLSTLKYAVLRDTPFADLMNKRIYNVLLIATKYDAFMLEDDGRVDEQIFNEYTALSLRYPPRFTRVTTEEEALAALADRNFELIIVMPNMDNRDIFSDATDIKRRYPNIPIVVLTPFSREVSKRVAHEDLSSIDYVFSWLGNAELLLAIIKLIEDKWNAPHDVASVGVQIILLVEDSIRFYSAALPHLYKFVLEQSQAFSEEALNDHLKTMRMRGRPKIMLARTYEEALSLFHDYRENILGVVSDMSFAREGQKDPLAGLRLARHIRQLEPHTPIILESSEAANVRYADELQTSFIQKTSKQYPQALRREVMAHFGFGDFVIINPTTGEELMRLKNLQDLQRRLSQIPDDSLRYHLAHNHFSRFFFSRAMFPPAVLLKHVDVTDYVDMSEARQLIADLIANYRRMKNEGVVAIYRRDRFDEYSNFARIGNGSLGGKGRGLAFMGTMVKRNPRLERDNFTLGIPKTIVVCTDIFDEFMEANDLYTVALSDITDEALLAAFEEATLPEQLIDDLASLLDVMQGPIAVRSSSLLEDSHYQPFAGVYKTYMVPHVPNKVAMQRLVRSAIKAVYASVFYRESKAYLTATQNLIDQEKMAIVLQEVVGSAHQPLPSPPPRGGSEQLTASAASLLHDITSSQLHNSSVFYPTLSGVARSLNFYPVGDERPEEGVVNLAYGLGKYIVDGGRTLRFSPRHPHHILSLSSPATALRETQRQFYALDLIGNFRASERKDASSACSLCQVQPKMREANRGCSPPITGESEGVGIGNNSTSSPLHNITSSQLHFSTDDAFNLRRLELRDVEATPLADVSSHLHNFRASESKDASSACGLCRAQPKMREANSTSSQLITDPSLRYVVSTYDPTDQVLRPGLHDGGRKVLTFDGILQGDTFPLAATIDRLLQIGRDEMGRHVEIEFAVQIDGDTAHFYLLQMRPLVDSNGDGREDIQEDLTQIPVADTLLTTTSALGNGIVTDVSDILYVPTADYNPADNTAIAREVEQLCRRLTDEGRTCILIGPGRWGSSDPWLGIPVKWAHIACARLIVELGLTDYRPDPSQGTHFFQNLTSFGVGYFTISPAAHLDHFDEAYLRTLPAVAETAHVRHVRRPEPFTIKMDGRHSCGVVLK